MIKEFTLGAIKWEIKTDDNRLDDLNMLGLCEFIKSTISIYEKGMDTNLIEQTIYHELVHAILDTMGERELSANDKFVQNFALLLHQFEKTKS
jgi:hypothetical protein